MRKPSKSEEVWFCIISVLLFFNAPGFLFLSVISKWDWTVNNNNFAAPGFLALMILSWMVQSFWGMSMTARDNPSHERT
jgi:hypothetical protein